MKYEAVIFDLDGVVCSTDRYHYQAWRTIAAELGIELDEARNNRLRGVGRMESLDIILEGYPNRLTAADKRFWAEKKNSLYQHYLQKVSPDDMFPDFPPVLTYLQQRGIKTAIGSSSKNARTILTRIGLEQTFDVVVDGTDISQPKPAPEVFLSASRLLGVAPTACLVVEDSEAGLQAALKAHMDCAAIGDGVRYGIATYNLSSLKDLLEIKGLS